MKKLLFIVALFFATSLFAQQETKLPPNSAAIIYPMPDTLKAVQYYCEVMVDSNAYCKSSLYGSYFSEGAIGLYADKKGNRSLFFQINNKGNRELKLITKGLHITEVNDSTVQWNHDWQTGKQYKLLLSIIADSASQSTYHTGYVFLPNEQQWKLLASFQKMNDGRFIKKPGVLVSALKTSKDKISRKLFVKQAWVQRDNGSWKEFDTSCKASIFKNIASIQAGGEYGKGIFVVNEISTPNKENTTAYDGQLAIGESHSRPVIDITRHVDSLEQLQLDLQEMNAAVQSGKIDTTGSKENVYYKILKEGFGDVVNVSDSVTIFYKGSLLKDGSVFDSTKEKPVTFPLRRLIKGWQIGVPLIKVGGKVRLYIPSNWAYSIRSRSKAIPPNSVLVFDVEVLGVKK